MHLIRQTTKQQAWIFVMILSVSWNGLAYVVISVCNLIWSHVIRGPYCLLTANFQLSTNLGVPNFYLFQLVVGNFAQLMVKLKLTTVVDFQRSSVTRPQNKYLPQKQINLCFPNLLFSDTFWLRIITTDPHILDCVNIEFRDDRHQKLKIYASELILDCSEYIPVA